MHDACFSVVAYSSEEYKDGGLALIPRLYTHPMLLYKQHTVIVYYSLYVQLQVQHQGHIILLTLKAGSIPRLFERFHDCKTRSPIVLSLILVKDLLVPSMYTFTGESKLQ